MTLSRLEQVWAAARAEHRAEVGWQPDERTLRRRRRAGDACYGALALGWVLSWAVTGSSPDPLDRALRVLLLGYFVVPLVGMHVEPFRSRYLSRVRDEVRLRHALRAHVGIGAAERDRVTEEAERRIASGPAVPAAVAVGAFLLLVWLSSETELPSGWIGAAAVGASALFAAWLPRWRRSRAEARRWLADPQPPVRHRDAASGR